MMTKNSLLKRILLGLLIILIITGGGMAWFIHNLFRDPDMASLPGYYPYKSQKAKARYLEYYDTRVGEWPVPSDTLTVTTDYGRTFVRLSGPTDAQPLVLLPSTNSSALIWMPNIAGLSQHYRVYTVDNIYDVGRSVNTRAIRSPNDMVAWLDGLFTALDLGSEINLAGLSFGGWLTSQYTLAHPERLHKAVWCAPAATIYNFPPEWAWRGILSALPMRFFMQKYMVNWLFEDFSRRTDSVSRQLLDKLTDDARLTLKCYRFRMPVTPTVLTDAELQSISVPVLFLVGENEKIYDGRQAVERINRVAPQIQTSIIPNAGHDLTIIQANLVNKLILEFLSEPE